MHLARPQRVAAGGDSTAQQARRRECGSSSPRRSSPPAGNKAKWERAESARAEGSGLSGCTRPHSGDHSAWEVSVRGFGLGKEGCLASKAEEEHRQPRETRRVPLDLPQATLPHRHCSTAAPGVCGHSGRLRARAAMRPTHPRRSEFGSTY